jgi:uncharacterized protein (DUF4415 family)
MKKRPISDTSRTNWDRLRGTGEDEIDTSDIPELTPQQFARAVVRRGLAPVRSKAQVTLRIDQDVLNWFREQGPGYQTKINALLRAYMDAHPR